ncbi:MAG TPA: HEAT repeat domain-containing protein [Candidatus Sulfomarinibacteraceae bacterium]|nr:HEAT repeat domain-containing protein [Candidatus Sulfomarinibacteraceae bacterium]
MQQQLGEEQVAALMARLADGDEAVRAAALRALVSLPLDEESWRRVGAYLLVMLGAEGGRASEESPWTVRRVAGALGIDEEAVANLPPPPREALIEAAVYVPLNAVRDRLRELAASAHEDDRWRAALALARAGDRAALPPLLQALQDDDEEKWHAAAYALGGIDVSGHKEAVRQAFAEAERYDGSGARFWLALALARAGEMEALEEVLVSGDTGYWGDPIQFDEMVLALPYLPQAVLDWLDQQMGNEAVSESARSFAYELTFLYEPPRPPQPEPPAPTREEEQADERAAREMMAQIRAWLAEEVADASQQPDTENLSSLSALSPTTAAELVNTVWELALHDRDRLGLELGNRIGFFVDELRRPFWPNVPALFDCFRRVEAAAPERYQLAWQISRAGLQKALAALRPYLQSEEAAVRADAVRLVELCGLYHLRPFPPVFGGGAAPTARPSLLAHRPEAGVKGSIGRAKLELYEEMRQGGDSVSLHEEMLDADPKPALEPEFEEIDFSKAVIDREVGAGDAGSLDEVNFAVPPSPARAAERVVNTGFAPGDDPADLLQPTQPLQAGSDYFFWLQIGAPMEESIESEPVSLPEVPEKARLTVVLFGFRDELQVREGADVGELEVVGPSARVLRQPADYADDWPARGVRLYFPVRVPDEPGAYHLRCSIYWGQLLLQSRLITANAVAPGARPDTEERQLRSDLDYTISNRLQPAHIKQLEPAEMSHRLSLMINSNGDATHNVYVFGRDGDTVVKKGDLRFGELALAEMIENARRKLRLASWGHEEEHREEWAYRYGEAEQELQAWRDGRPGGDAFIRKLRLDLAHMAKNGHRFYDKLVDELQDDDAERFAELLAQPSMLQIAFRRSIQHLLPAALVYDYRIMTTAEPEQFQLCATFEQALREGTDLLQTSCWPGACPERQEWAVICPSGFWGFRHYLGMPLTLCGEEESADDGRPCPVPDPPPFLTDGAAELRLGVGVATDLPMWGAHEQQLYGLQPQERWTVIDDINKLLRLLDDPPHVLYFYCHGGLDDVAATLEFGPANPRARIDRTIWGNARWEKPRPLVFINGCHTTAVTPEKAMDLVEPLLRRAHSAGVIGTEVTIFEPLATRFAEACFRRFFAGAPIGQALRDARVDLLQEGNPLGLVYIPFVLAGLRLRGR